MRLRPILLSLALLCASSQVLATPARHMDPDGSGSCPENAATSSADAEEADSDAAAAPARRNTQKAKPTPAARGGGSSGQRSNAPRWHSFLPGMFR